MFYEKNKDLKQSYEKFVKSGSLNYRRKEMPIWCPGCGDFSVAHALILALNELGLDPKSVAISAGIGCSGRFPVFVSCYGLHGVHGRSLPVATGMKMGNEKLTVLAVGGDGDGLGIGGGHLPHVARNNVDVTYIMLDNSIYGLTKGQTSPTAFVGTVSKTTPYGSEGIPLNAAHLVLSYHGAFVARAFSGYPHDMKEMIKKAIQHKGFSFIQALSPCVMFNKVQTYDFFFEKCKRLPAQYEAKDRVKAMQYASDPGTIYTGILFDQPRKPFGYSWSSM